ncbi:uncharacterized protein [Henckelia pumila]|uniref:uncharacterized protein n=1 Tax=Henckelia pumila TaxID=405737 RepID=UPI003C6DB938
MVINKISDTDREAFTCLTLAQKKLFARGESLHSERSIHPAMEIPDKLLKFKLHILLAFAFAALIFFLCYLAPPFLDILYYFWPLLLSTALFLVAVVVFGRISAPETDSPGENAVEGLLDFPDGQSEQVIFR